MEGARAAAGGGVSAAPGPNDSYEIVERSGRGQEGARAAAGRPFDAASTPKHSSGIAAIIGGGAEGGGGGPSTLPQAPIIAVG